MENKQVPKGTKTRCPEHHFSQNQATCTKNFAQNRSVHISMQLTLFVYNINAQYFCIKSGLNYLSKIEKVPRGIKNIKMFNRKEIKDHIFFCNLNFHRNVYTVDKFLSPQEDIDFILISCSIIYRTLLDHINTFKSYFHEFFFQFLYICGIYKANAFV